MQPFDRQLAQRCTEECVQRTAEYVSVHRKLLLPSQFHKVKYTAIKSILSFNLVIHPSLPLKTHTLNYFFLYFFVHHFCPSSDTLLNLLPSSCLQINACCACPLGIQVMRLDQPSASFFNSVHFCLASSLSSHLKCVSQTVCTLVLVPLALFLLLLSQTYTCIRPGRGIT